MLFSACDFTILPRLLWKQTDTVDKRLTLESYGNFCMCLYLLVTAFRERNLARLKILNSHQNKWELKVLPANKTASVEMQIWKRSGRRLYVSVFCNNPCFYRGDFFILLNKCSNLFHSQWVSLQLPQCLLSPASGKYLFGRKTLSWQNFKKIW